MDVFAATNAIAAAAEMSMPAVAIRRDDRIRFEPLKVSGVFIDLEM
jgi:hypothetical protein